MFIFKIHPKELIKGHWRAKVEYYIPSNPYKPRERYLRLDKKDNFKSEIWRRKQKYDSAEEAQKAAKASRRYNKAEIKADRPETFDPVFKEYMDTTGQKNIRKLVKAHFKGTLEDKYKEPLKKFIKKNPRLGNAYAGSKKKRIRSFGV
jgi:phage repressor protein C with HTH and peptisase S24 domain